MDFDAEKHALEHAAREVLEPDYSATLRGIVRRVRSQFPGHPPDEIYDVIIEQATADLPGFQPNRDELMRISFEIEEGILSDSEVEDIESDPTPAGQG
jgi:hypothetical protein